MTSRPSADAAAVATSGRLFVGLTGSRGASGGGGYLSNDVSHMRTVRSSASVSVSDSAFESTASATP